MDEYISREMAVKKLQMQLLNLEADQDKGEYSELCENRGARDALDEAIYDIRTIKAADIQPVNQWISVKDRQPKCIRGSSDSVLVHRDNGECEVAYLVYDNDDGFYWYTQDERTAFEFEEVTHWMLLPEPPKGGDADA